MFLNIFFHILFKHHIAFPHLPASFDPAHGILKLFYQCIFIFSFTSCQICLHKIKQCCQFFWYFSAVFSVCVQKKSADSISKCIPGFFTVFTDGIPALFLTKGIKVANENDICICQFAVTSSFFQHFHIHLAVIIAAAPFQAVFFHQLHLNIIMRLILILCKYIHADAFVFRIKEETMFPADLYSSYFHFQHALKETPAVFRIHHNSCEHKIVVKYQFFQCFFTHFLPP